jgi:hypothetical protein
VKPQEKLTVQDSLRLPTGMLQEPQLRPAPEMVLRDFLLA